MVVFSIKSGGQDGFLYEASVQDLNEDVIAGLVSCFCTINHQFEFTQRCQVRDK